MVVVVVLRKRNKKMLLINFKGRLKVESVLKRDLYSRNIKGMIYFLKSMRIYVEKKPRKMQKMKHIMLRRVQNYTNLTKKCWRGCHAFTQNILKILNRENFSMIQ
jgi:hypothetical protein